MDKDKLITELQNRCNKLHKENETLKFRICSFEMSVKNNKLAHPAKLKIVIESDLELHNRLKSSSRMELVYQISLMIGQLEYYYNE